MHILDKLQPPVIFAHRGASKYAPENTMAAFNLAVQHGAPAIELDVMLTKDQIPIVIHDFLLDRTTNGTGRVDEHLYHWINDLDAGSYFSPEFSGEKIPLLSQVLEAFHHNLLINIELKNYHATRDALVERTVEIVEKLSMEPFILFSSFLPRNLVRVRQLIPHAKVALLCSQGIFPELCTSRIFFNISREYIHPVESIISKKFVKKEHGRNRRINAWTVNDPDRMLELISWGVDGIITDDTLSATRIAAKSL